MSLMIKNISKSWGGVDVLTNVCLDIESHKITGLIGPNGAGKSTLFGVVAGNVTQDTGSVTFKGTPFVDLRLNDRARLGLLRTFQVPRPFSNLTVYENLAVSAPDVAGESLRNVLFRPNFVRMIEREIGAKANQIIATLNLGKVANLRASQLSGGQLKLLELGRLLMTEPKLILLDEPFAGVNPVLAEEIAKQIVALNKIGIGFFIVEHNLPALSRLAEIIYVMDKGTLIASGSSNEVLNNPQVQAAYLGGKFNDVA